MLYGSEQFGSDARFGNDGHTVLLLHFRGEDGSTAVFDSSKGKHTFTLVGNTQIDTAQSKFDGSSLLFDGTGDYLQCDGSSDFAFGTNDFTIDFWIRPRTIVTDIIYDSRPTGTNGFYVTIYMTSLHIVFFTNGANRITGTTDMAVNTLYHVAVTRSGTSTKLFLNGTQEGSTYTDSNSYLNAAATRPFIGGDANAPNTNLVDGHVDELRVLNGFAAWTENFTPPTTPYE